MAQFSMEIMRLTGPVLRGNQHLMGIDTEDRTLNEVAKINSGLSYGSLLIGQTMAALFLFWMAFPIFSWLVTHLGERQNLIFGDQIAIALSTLLLHCLY